MDAENILPALATAFPTESRNVVATTLDEKMFIITD
jgi:hypothetical protein